MKITTDTFQALMDEADRRIQYYTGLWLDEKEIKKRKVYLKKVNFYEKMYTNLSQQLLALLKERYGRHK